MRCGYGLTNWLNIDTFTFEHPLTPNDFYVLDTVKRYNGAAITVSAHTRICVELAALLLNAEFCNTRSGADLNHIILGKYTHKIGDEDFINCLIIKCLLHDLHEAFTGDIPNPIKRVLNSEALAELEDSLDLTIATDILGCFGHGMDSHLAYMLFSDDIKSALKKIDYLAFMLESAVITGLNPISLVHDYLRIDLGEDEPVYSNLIRNEDLKGIVTSSIESGPTMVSNITLAMRKFASRVG